MAHAPAAGAGCQHGRRQGENLAAVDVLQQPVLKCRVAHRVVRPRRELVHAAVAGPAHAAAGFRHLKAKVRIGDDIDPGARQRLAAPQVKPELAVGRVELAGPLHRLCNGRHAFGQVGRGPARKQRSAGQAGLLGRPDANAQGGHLRFQPPAVRCQNHPRQPGQCGFLGSGGFGVAQQVKAR